MDIKKYLFSIENNEIAIGQFIDRYHFDEKDRELLCATGRFLSEVTAIEAGILYLPKKIVCVATLGRRFDKLVDIVAESECLLLSYSLECFGMEFLSKAYERMNEAVFKETGKWMGEYRFLGEENVEEIESNLAEFGDLPVVWEKGMLHPLKSVIFTAEYKENREESGCHNCEQCRNVTCSFRRIVEERNKPERNVNNIDVSGSVYSYGISRIFGGGDK